MATEIETNRNYEEIERPYDNFLERSDTSVSIQSNGESNDSSSNPSNEYGNSTPATNNGGNGSVETQPVKSEGGIGDVWIKNFIRSENWKPKSVGFYIDGTTGYAEFMNVFISGNITAITGTIGGFHITATTIYSGGLTLTSGASASLAFGTTPPTSPSNGTGIYIDKTGLFGLDSDTQNFKISAVDGSITAISGTIGGNVINSTSLSSATFVSGPLGSGWQINNTGTAEFQNVIVRGIIKTSVFEKGTISAVNGMVLVSSADALASNMTALDSSTLTITGETTFVANEVVRIKDGVDDEWMLVTDASAAPTYTVTRDLAGSYASNSNPTWKSGTAVVSMGVGTGTKTGFVLIDSSSANSPYIDVYGRNSNTYTDYTIHGRFGWLKGITDADVGLSGTDVWGLYTDNAYIKGTIVATSGTIGGFELGTDYIRDVANSFGLASTVTGGDDIRFWAGETFANRATAPLRITEAGEIIASNIDVSGGSITGVTITGGTIRTDSGSNRIELSSSSNSILLYDGGDKVSEIEPTSTQGVGCTQWFYDDSGTDNDVAKLEYDYFVSGAYHEQSLSLFINSTDGNSGAGLILYADTDNPTAKLINIAPKLNSSIANFDGFNDLGDSTNLFDDIWGDTIHYNTLSAISDKRLKKNINPISYGLNEVLLLNPVKFKWKKDDGDGYGFIAQEVRQIIPPMVRKVEEKHQEEVRKPDGRRKKIITYTDVKVKGDPAGETMLQIDTSLMIPILVKAIQELNEKVEKLEKK